MNLEAGHAGRDLNAGRVCRSWRGSHTFDIHVEIHSTKSRGLRSQHNHVFIKISELHDQDAKWQGVLPWGPNCIDSLEGKCEWSVPNSRRVSWIGLWSVPEFIVLGVGPHLVWDSWFAFWIFEFGFWISSFLCQHVVNQAPGKTSRQNLTSKLNPGIEHCHWNTLGDKDKENAQDSQ